MPIHFFTIVLNGMPYIQYHIHIFNKLDIPWHWHIVEGLATLAYDTISHVGPTAYDPIDDFPSRRSNDGTSEYLDDLVKLYPNNITLYRKPVGISWDGKIEMVRAPQANIGSDSLLWQVDNDELWTTAQIQTMYKMFIDDPSRTSAWFWCHYFISPDRVITTRDCYSQNSRYEWHRVWRYKPGMKWITHEPPKLIEVRGNSIISVGSDKPFIHDETEASGLVFQHMSYTTESQLLFKEKYYGYQNASQQWRSLMEDKSPKVKLRDYLSWVKDDAIAEFAVDANIVPLWDFNS